jgi:PPOX class probable F420-dependent enzyme
VSATVVPEAATRDAPIPPTHRDLLERPICAVLTTLMPGGQPHSTLTWVDYDGVCARVNTTLERCHARNLQRDTRASLLVVDPDDTSRFVAIRGTVELVSDGALEHLDSLTRAYTSRPAFYGFIYPEEQRFRETRVIGRIHAHRITLDAIHAAGGADQAMPVPTSLPTR